MPEGPVIPDACDEERCHRDAKEREREHARATSRTQESSRGGKKERKGPPICIDVIAHHVSTVEVLDRHVLDVSQPHTRRELLRQPRPDILRYQRLRQHNLHHLTLGTRAEGERHRGRDTRARAVRRSGHGHGQRRSAARSLQ